MVLDPAMIASEQELAAIAGALTCGALLLDDERALLAEDCPADAHTVCAIRDLIAAGQDPLGDAFLTLRSAEQRRDAGAVYTPAAIVAAMIGWAVRRETPVRVVDPGAGSGRFIVAAARAFPDAALVACDIDPVATLILRANAAVLGFADRLSVELRDYRLLDLATIDGPTLYIGNPPYVRHHKINAESKKWFGEAAGRLGFKASKLAGLHIHFFLRTREIASPGDYGAFVTSSEWMDVNYGSLLRGMLADGLGGSSLQVFSPQGMPFTDTMTTGAITTFAVGRRPDQFTVREIASASELDDLDVGRRVSWDEVRREDRWSKMVRQGGQPAAGMIALGDVFRVHRGAVTGDNAVFIAGPHHDASLSPWLVPAVTRARDLIDAGGQLTAANARHLRQLVALPANHPPGARGARRAIEQFKRWAQARGGDQSWTARQRKAWWSLVLRDPAPILCTYMGRRPPVFVRNLAGVPHINIAHGLYPRVTMTAADLDAYSAWLSNNVCASDGRTYAGGLTKFEPKEIERLLVPSLDNIHGASHSMDRPADRQGCRAGEGAVSR